MSFWVVASIVARVGIMLVLVYKLTVWHDSFNSPERVGMGMAAGSVVMTLPALWHAPENPFAEWAAAIFMVGLLVYFAGRLWRLQAHYSNNREAIRKAREHLTRLAERG